MRGMPTDIVTPQTWSKSVKVDLTIQGSYSKPIEIPYRELWVYMFQYLHYKSQHFTELLHVLPHI